MAHYKYSAINASGETVEGQLQADSVGDVRWQLMERGLQPERINEAAPAPQSSFLSPDEWFGVRSVDVELSLRQVAVMIRSGMTLLMAIETVIEDPPSRAVGRVYRLVLARVEGGASFADALSEHKCFPPGVVSMLAMGEESGNLDSTMERSAQTMETRRNSKKAALTALFYPTFTFVFALGIFIYMVVAVIPPMKRALEALGRPMPAMTQSLLDVADFFTRWGVAIGSVVLLFGVVLLLLWNWPPGRIAIDRILLRIPLVGTILRTSATALFSRSMGTLLGSGIALVEGLRIVGNIHGNSYLEAVLESASRSILEGGSLAESLAQPYAYSPMMLKMVSVGEASGNLEETLEYAADFHDDQLQALIKSLSALLEPAVILVVGSMVGYVYIAFFVGLYGGV